MKTYPLPIYVQRFFSERLVSQIHASPHTIASYRDTFRLLLKFVSNRLDRMPAALHVADVNAELVGQFLNSSEENRNNSARSRNARLSAIRSFFKYVALNEPQLLYHCQQILAMPPKRYEKRTISYLSRNEIEALIAAPDTNNWFGRRDHILLLLALQTGLRVSELCELTYGDIALGTGAHVRCFGKGRKERITPLRKDCVKTLQTWFKEYPGEATHPLFVSNRGTKLSRDAIEQIVRKHTVTAAKQCPSLKTKHITPHVLRHSVAMELLHSGVDRTVIALWLGHESIETTEIYIHADIRLKERAMERTKPIAVPSGRYHPDDELLTFLESL